MSATTLAPELCLPWESTAEDDRRFLIMLCSMLLAFGVLSLVVPQLSVSEPGTVMLEEAPPALVKILLEEQALPEAAIPPPKLVEKLPEPPEPVKSVKEKPREKPKPVDRMELARKAAAVSGLLAFQDDLSEMRESVDVNKLSQTQMRRGQESAATTERAIVTGGIAADSGGIKTSAISLDTGGAALSARESTRVQSTIASTERSAGRGQSVSMGGRSDEAIRRVMDKNKGAIFAIYNRALRKDPLLQGKLAFEMVVDPSGSIVRLTLVSSEISDIALINKILSRIRFINFGAEDVRATSVSYSLDFLPYI